MTALRIRPEEPTSGLANQKLGNWLRTRYRGNVKVELMAGAISREDGVNRGHHEGERGLRKRD